MADVLTTPAPPLPLTSAPRLVARGLLLALAIAAPQAGTIAAGQLEGTGVFPGGYRLHIVAQVWGVNAAINAVIIAVVFAGRRMLRARRAHRAPALVMLALLASAAGVALGWVAESPYHGEATALQYLPYVWQRQLMVAALLVFVAEFIDRGRQARERLHRNEVARIALDAELSAARLQLLQAQVEPHFLFNSLANLRRLQHTDVPAARQMLGALLRYLEEALPRLREPGTTLGREAELVRAYLALHQVRMGARLHVVIDVPDELRSQPVPPMMLLTLAENAIKHGLQPCVAGGELRVAAGVNDGRLVLTVADTGRGMGSASGGGLGLANLRARLKALHGNAAILSLRLNEPSGVVATITMPLAGPP